MGKARNINPCWFKGRDLGYEGQGRNDGLLGCECQHKVLSNDKARLMSYAQVSQNGRVRTVEVKNDVVPKRGLLVQPCNATFLERTSKGTKFFKKHNHETKFKGCRDLENDLLNQGYLSTDHLLSVSIRGFEPEKDIDVLHTVDVQDVEVVFRHRGTLQNVSHPHPKDLRQSLLRNLIERRDILNLPDGKDLYIAAIILDRGFNLEGNKHLVLFIFPEYDISKFEAHCAKLSFLVEKEARELNKYSGDRIKKLRRAWKSLTVRQKNVIERMYEDSEHESLEDIAKSLKRSVATVRDHINGAKKKFKKHFPELVPISQQELPYTKAELHRHEIQLNGFYRLSNAEKIQPCTITNKKTGEITTVVAERAILKTNFDKEYKSKVWAWINNVSPIIKIGDYGLITNNIDMRGTKQTGQNEEP